MSARDAAVRAVAAAIRQPVDENYDPDAVARIAIAALATSADVRGGLVAALNAAEGWYDPEGARTGEGEPIPGIRVWVLADAVLAALGGADDA